MHMNVLFQLTLSQIILYLFLRHLSRLRILWITAFISFFFTCPLNAVQELPADFDARQNLIISSSMLNDQVSGQLEETSPPGGVQQLRRRLEKYEPEIKLVSPDSGTVIPGEDWNLVFELRDWPLVNDSEFGIGPHLVVQIDNGEPIRVSHAEGNQINIPMKGLSPGTHRFGAYAAYPWGEAVKKTRSSIQFQLHCLEELIGTQPELNMPWIMVVSPFENSPFEPLLIDSLIWNAPIQNINENDLLWHLRITVNGTSFLMNRPEAIWVKRNQEERSMVQFELIDAFGDPIQPVFNNFLREVRKSNSSQPIWMKSKMTEEEISRLIGETKDIEENLGPKEELDQIRNPSLVSQGEAKLSIWSMKS